MKNKVTTGAVALGIVALLAGGTTLAYWADNDTTTAATITSGRMSITANADNVWHDVSNASGKKNDTTGLTWNQVIALQNFKGAGNQGALDLTSFRIVPGDTLVGRQTFNLTAVGDNLNATLDVDVRDSATGTLLSDVEGLSVKTTLYDAKGAPVASSNGGPSKATVTVYSAEYASDMGIEDGPGVLIVDDTTQLDDLKVSVEAYFDENTSNLNKQNATAALNSATINLVQGRNL